MRIGLFWAVCASVTGLGECFSYSERLLITSEGAGYFELALTQRDGGNPEHAVLLVTSLSEGLVGFSEPTCRKFEDGQAMVGFRAYFEDIGKVRFRVDDKKDFAGNKGVMRFEFSKDDGRCKLVVYDYSVSGLIRHGLIFRGNAPQEKAAKEEMWNEIAVCLKDPINRKITMPGTVTKCTGFSSKSGREVVLDWSVDSVRSVEEAFAAPPYGVRTVESECASDLANSEPVRREVETAKRNWPQLKRQLEEKVKGK